MGIGGKGNDYEAVQSFAARWARGTLLQAQRFREAREQAHVRDWQYERLEDWSPAWHEVLEALHDAWVEAHLLVVAAHQLDAWGKRLVESGGPSVPAAPELLRYLRNSVEHLDQAVLGDESAMPDQSLARKSWALENLPGGALPLGGGMFVAQVRAFGLVDVDEIEATARAALAAIEDEIERPAVEAYLQLLDDERRGK